jgi:hypothetical protein
MKKMDIIGWDFAGEAWEDPLDADNDPADPFGHGTHVAGIIGASGNNDGIGIAGVSWNPSLMALKVFAEDGEDIGSEGLPGAVLSDILNAYNFAREREAQVINASFGGSDFSQGEYDAIAALRDAGILFVASAGNSSSNIPEYPAAYNLDNIISVMASNPADGIASYSNYGSDWVDLAAPGGDSVFPFSPANGQILSTFEDTWGYMQGTSMAAPHVTGAAALIWGLRPNLNYTHVKEIILSSVDTAASVAAEDPWDPRIYNLSQFNGRCTSGGRLNLYKAIKMITIGRVRNFRNGVPVEFHQSINVATIRSASGDEIVAEAGFWFYGQFGYKGKNLIIRSGNVDEYVADGSDQDPNNTIISDLFGSGNLVTVDQGITSSSLKGFTIRDGGESGVYITESSSIEIENCIITNNSGGMYGSGIHCEDNSQVTIVDCEIKNNSNVDYGAGIYATDDSYIEVHDTMITNNQCRNDGAGVYLESGSELLLIGSEIRSNRTQAGNLGVGGGIYCSDGILTIDNSSILWNRADWTGGGLNLENVTGSITTSVLEFNRANYAGGAVYLDSASDFEIIDTEIMSNTADYWGGGIYFLNSSNNVLVKNCLFTDNSVDSWDGGALYFENSSPDILNCTIDKNSAGNGGGIGGGIACYDSSKPNITNCIVSNNQHYGIGIYIDDIDPPYEDCIPISEPNITYSLFYQNSEGDYIILDECTGQLYNEYNGADELNSIGVNHDILDGNPMFVPGRLGDYYLSQADAGQQLDPNGEPSDFPSIEAKSPAVDTGSVQSFILGLDTYTTRTNNLVDGETVDMGYHYFDESDPVFYELTFEVIPEEAGTLTPRPDQAEYVQYSHVILTATALPEGDPDYQFKQWHGTDDDNRILIDERGEPCNIQTNVVTMSSHKEVAAEYITIMIQLITSTSGESGTIIPTLHRPRFYKRGTIVQLIAEPDNPSHVIIWSGTDDDFEISRYNTITMVNDPERVNAEFYAPQTLHVPGEFQYIQQALNASHDRDIVLLAETGASQPYSSEDGFFITSAVTISSERPDDPTCVANTVVMRVVGEGSSSTPFQFFGVGRNAVLNGFTIRGGPEGQVVWWTGMDGIDPEPDAGNFDGHQGGSPSGGAVICLSASPTIKNCIINVQLQGGNGSDGAGGNDVHPNGGNGGWPGGAYGGGVYVSGGSPLFLNCIFEGCQVQGGNGGNGGGGNEDLLGWGGRGGGYYYSFVPQPWEFGPFLEPYKYSGLGGAAYIGWFSGAEFKNCQFNNCQSHGGFNGICGPHGWPPNDIDEPSISWRINNLGGAVFCDELSNVTFTDCVFTNNTADTDPNANPPTEPILTPFVSYGGAVAFENTSNVRFEDCAFTNNLSTIGGALYWNGGNPELDDCSFVGNTAYHGGGILCVNGNPRIVESVFSNNIADFTGSNGGAITCLGTNAMILDCQIIDNDANASGGGIYLSNKDLSGQTIEDDESFVLVKNCLIADNLSKRDGGGISINWYSDVNVVNCTITNNLVTGQQFEHSYGGAIATSYGSFVNILNTIAWSNTAELGNQLSIQTGFDGDPRPSTVSVSYSDIHEGSAQVFVDTGDPAIQGDDSTLIWDSATNKSGLGGDPDSEPLFASNPLGDRFLSQVDAGQAVDSPLIDAGMGTAYENHMYKHTTRTDMIMEDPDSIVDMGYHYVLQSDLIGDFNYDGVVDLKDLEIFNRNMLSTGCDFPYWCNEADLNKDGIVNFIDYGIFAGNFGDNDFTPPYPDPMTWDIPPVSASNSSIYMRASTAFDAITGDQVEYYFYCTTNGEFGDWQTSNEWTHTGLTTGEVYCYEVKARDTSPNWNETEYSIEGCAIPGGGGGGPQAPAAPSNLFAKAVSDSQIVLTWNDNSNNESGFRIERSIAGEPFFSQIATVGANDTTYTNGGLPPDTTCTYRVRAFNSSGNSTYSNTSTATTLPQGQVLDEVPPLPDPSIWAVLPTEALNPITSSYWHTMTATVASDALTGGSDPVEYYFNCIDTSTFDSGWQLSQDYTVEISSFPKRYKWRFRTRDQMGNVTQWSPVVYVAPAAGG